VPGSTSSAGSQNTPSTFPPSFASTTSTPSLPSRSFSAMPTPPGPSEATITRLPWPSATPVGSHLSTGGRSTATGTRRGNDPSSTGSGIGVGAVSAAGAFCGALPARSSTKPATSRRVE
jgi:hypothetical protein